MKQKIKRSIVIVFSLIMLISNCFFFETNAISDNSEKTEMNLDVVFVIDASGSMKDSDKNKIALDAFNLFLDECDDTCGVGYVIYSDTIKKSKEITMLDTETNRISLKKEIASTGNNREGNTDIALGVSKAISFLESIEKADKSRNRAIILLSDGNTYLYGSSRTTEASKKELKSDIETLSKKGIPVFSIGLNADGSLDKKEMEDIASKTGGLSFIPSSADSLPGVTAQIMAHYLNTEPVTPDFNDGNIDFNVDNKSIYSLYIHIFSNKSIKDINPILTAPSGYQISLDGKNVKVTSTNSYTLIKLFSPDVGRWNLKLTGVTNKNCTVSLTTVYSIFLKQSVNPTSVTGGKTQITATLNNSKGQIDDSDLLKTLTVTAEISGAENKNVPLSNDGKGNFTGEFLVSNGGSYTIVTKAVSSDKKFNKESEAFSFEAVAPMGNDMVVIEQTLSAKEIHSGESVTVLVRVKNKETGEIITLPDSVMTAYLKGKEGNNISDVPLKKNDSDTYEGTISISEKGDYKIVTVATDNATGNTKSSTETRLLVTRPSMTLKNPEPIHIKLKSLPFKSSEKFVLNDYIRCEGDDVLKIDFSPTQSEFYNILSSKSSDGYIVEVTGSNVGSGETQVLVTNQYGEKLGIRLIVEVENSWSTIIIAVIIIVGALVLLYIIFLIVRPKLSGEIEISLSMPEKYISYQPGKLSRKVPNKYRISIGKLFKRNGKWSDSAFGRALSEADIEDKVSGITITAMFDGGAMIKGNGESKRNNYRCDIDGVDVSIIYIGKKKAKSTKAPAPHAAAGRPNRGRRN